MAKRKEPPFETLQEWEFVGGGDGALRDDVQRLGLVLKPVAGKLRNAAEAGSINALIDALRSEEPMSPADRDFLADVLSGDLGNHRGRKPLMEVEQERRKRAVAVYRERMKARPKPKQHALVAELAMQFGFQPDQMLSFVRKSPRNSVI